MKVTKNSIKDQVYTELRNKILNKEYAPGSVLNIVHLSHEFQVSNTPIREALSMLENEKLVSSNTNSKFRVIELDETLLQQLNSAIVTLLIGSVRLCIKENRLPVMEDMLEKALNNQKEKYSTTNQADRYWLAVEFDRSIIAATGSRILMDIFNNWSNLLYLSTSIMDESYNNSIEEHTHILHTVQGGSFMDIVEALETHYNKHFHPVSA